MVWIIISNITYKWYSNIIKLINFNINYNILTINKYNKYNLIKYFLNIMNIYEQKLTSKKYIYSFWLIIWKNLK